MSVRTPRKSSKSNSVSFTESLSQQGSEMLVKLHGVGTMSWILLAIITLYISLVNPSNTPSFFSNSVFKFVLFAFVVIVYVLEGPLIGTMFTIAMVLPVVYSSMREGYTNPFIEGYNTNDSEDASSDTDKNTHYDHTLSSIKHMISQVASKDAPNGASDGHTKDSSKDSSKDTTQDSSKDTTQDSSKDSTQDSSKDTTQDSSNDTTKDATKETHLNTSSDSQSSQPAHSEGWCNYAPFC